jgi:hypothetical protein
VRRWCPDHEESGAARFAGTLQLRPRPSGLALHRSASLCLRPRNRASVAGQPVAESPRTGHHRPPCAGTSVWILLGLDEELKGSAKGQAGELRIDVQSDRDSIQGRVPAERLDEHLSAEKVPFRTGQIFDRTRSRAARAHHGGARERGPADRRVRVAGAKSREPLCAQQLGPRQGEILFREEGMFLVDNGELLIELPEETMDLVRTRPEGPFDYITPLWDELRLRARESS